MLPAEFLLLVVRSFCLWFYDVKNLIELVEATLVLIQVDMTQILLNQEKYRRLLGDMNVQNILAQMHPTQSTVMDSMTDEERFSCVISRHCQTMSERQAVLQQLASEKSELTKYAQEMLAEQQSVPDSSSAPDTGAQ